MINYSVLRRAATPAQARRAAAAARGLGGRFALDLAGAREVPGTAATADPIFLVPAGDAICLWSAARRESGCDIVEEGLPDVTAHTIICSPYLPRGIGELYGTRPDGAHHLRVVLRDGHTFKPAVYASFYRYFWVKYRRALPRAVSWRAGGRTRSTPVPFPRGRGWLGCED